jgi:hypothetical protein
MKKRPDLKYLKHINQENKQQMESQNILSKHLGWGFLVNEKGIRYSSLCHADALMLAHDLNVRIDIDYETKEKFLNYAKNTLKTKYGKPYITSTGYVWATGLEFTQAYAKYIGSFSPTSNGDIKNNIGARYGVGRANGHSIVMDMSDKSVYFNTWTLPGGYGNNFNYVPAVRLKY